MNYNEDYYRSGNYTDYLQRAGRYQKLAEDTRGLLKNIGLDRGPVLDFGCAVGFLIEALNHMNYDTYGVEISEWALNECRRKNLNVSTEVDYSIQYGVTYALDVFEHMTPDELDQFLIKINTKCLIFRMPICAEGEDDYYLAGARNDKTHVIKWSKSKWKESFEKRGFKTLDLNLTTIYCGPGGYSGIALL